METEELARQGQLWSGAENCNEPGLVSAMAGRLRELDRDDKDDGAWNAAFQELKAENERLQEENLELLGHVTRYRAALEKIRHLQHSNFCLMKLPAVLREDCNCHVSMARDALNGRLLKSATWRR